MTRQPSGSVTLSNADRIGLATLALLLASLVGATLYQVHDLAAATRERLARNEEAIEHLECDVASLEIDLREVRRDHYGE